MTENQLQDFFKRIDSLPFSKNPKFGKMNANQMICHCTDQLRLAMGTFKALEYNALSPDEVIALARARKTIPTAKGLDQVEGGGTKPTNFENDKSILKEHLVKFSKLPDDFNWAPHPYLGQVDKKRWTEITQYHLGHHFKQFKI